MTQSVRFKSRPARYFGLVIHSAHGWKPEAYLEKLALVGEDTEEQASPYLDSSGWKLVASNVKEAQLWRFPSRTSPPKPSSNRCRPRLCSIWEQNRPSPGSPAWVAPRSLPNGIAVYLTTGQAPEIVPVALDQERITGEFKFLNTVQEMIYNQLLALKGGEFEKLEESEDLELAKLLGEKREEAAPSVTLAKAEIDEKIKEWEEENAELAELRKVLTSKPMESQDDENKLKEIDLMEGALKRDLEDMAEDLARQEWDFADKSEIELFEATLHNIQDKIDDERSQALRQWRTTIHRRI